MNSTEPRPHVPPAGARPGGASPTQAFTPDTDVHLLDRIAVLYRYRRIAIAVFVLTTAAMMIQGYSSIQYLPRAGASADRERTLDGDPGHRAPRKQFYEDPEPYYQTQYKILKGRDLTQRVVAKLELAQVPEFNGTLTPPATPCPLAQDLRRRFLALLWRQDERGARGAEGRRRRPTNRRWSSAFIGRVERRPGARQPPGGRLLRLASIRSSPPRPPTR